ncbi:MAG: DUF1648 domain-containing protein [Acidobacteriota bacterium]|nr:DUF1648 domain-containing protein [Acidobacteriota bacterium]
MERDRRPLYFWLLFAVADALISTYYWPRVPEMMAQHFDGAGHPNGWATKSGFFIFMGMLIAGLGVVFFGLPKLLRKLPFALVNIPYKSYWEATPERQKRAWDMTEQQMNWFAVALNALLTFTLYLTLAANLRPGRRLDSPTLIAALIAFVGFTVGWMVLFIRRFKPPETPETPETP